MVDELAALGNDTPVLPGHHAGHQRQAGAALRRARRRRVPRRAGRAASTPWPTTPPRSARSGVELATELCQTLLDAGVPGHPLLHAQPLHRDPRDLRQPRPRARGVSDLPAPDGDTVVVTAAARRRSSTVSWVLTIVIAVAVALVVRAFLFQMFWIPSESMSPTLEKGDRVIVTKFGDVSSPSRGDVMVFTRPPNQTTGEDNLIKRVIGLPGERIAFVDGKVFVNEAPLDEPYLPEGTQTVDLSSPGCALDAPCVVGPDQLWMMGDNRDHSADSRRFGADRAWDRRGPRLRQRLAVEPPRRSLTHAPTRSSAPARRPAPRPDRCSCRPAVRPPAAHRLSAVTAPGAGAPVTWRWPAACRRVPAPTRPRSRHRRTPRPGCAAGATRSTARGGRPGARRWPGRG